MISRIVWNVLRLVVLIGLMAGAIQLPVVEDRPGKRLPFRTVRRKSAAGGVSLAKKRSWHVMISDNWADMLDPIVRWRFQQGYARRVPLVPMLFNVQGSDRAYEQVSAPGAMGIDAWEQYDLTGTPGEADFDQGYKQTYTHRTYTLEYAVKRELLEDSNMQEIIRGSTNLGDSASLKREVDGASVFNNAFSDTFAGADSVGLCSTAHPFSPQKVGTTQSNEFTLPLTKDNVRTLREAMMAFTDDNGNKLAVTPNLILVPPALEDDAIPIAGSPLDPNSANNAVNPQAGRWMVQPWHYLTDSNAWFMIDTNLMKQSLDWFNRVPLSILPKEGDKTYVARWVARMRYSYGWSDWRWIAGSNPS